MADDIGILSDFMALEFNNFIIGEMLGEGVYRKVYVYRPAPDYVLKIEKSDRVESRFCNVDEWNLYWDAHERNQEIAKWLAPCLRISKGGSYLLQKRADPIKKLPKLVPNWMADVKIENMGLIKGKPVFVDYANNFIYRNGLKNHRLVSTVKPSAAACRAKGEG